MWCTWTTLLLVSSALVTAVTADVGAGAEATTPAPAPAEHAQPSVVVTTTQAPDPVAAEARLAVATTREPPRTLDRQAGELAWRTWLQSPESGNQNAPPRRITTKSLFITPLVCPKGQRLDRNGCVQVVTVNKDEHERILLEQLNALFSSPSSGDVLYDYGDDEPGPLQLSIPIGLDPQAQPLQNPEPDAQAQEQQPNYVQINKKDDNTNTDISKEAELELLKLQHSNKTDTVDAQSQNAMNNVQHFADKPKRDSPVNSSTEIHTNNNKDEGQKELVFGHVNVDPVLYNMEQENQKNPSTDFEGLSNQKMQSDSSAAYKISTDIKSNSTDTTNATENTTNVTKELHKDQTKLNPENDYSDIGEAIKLISRYAEVSTDDNFSKDQKKHALKEDSILGTRTKLQYRRNKPKTEPLQESFPIHPAPEIRYDDKMPPNSFYPKTEPFYRYPWVSQHTQTPPPNYPFRHLQDYWPGRNHIGGVYNTHGNPRRHHHSYPHYFRPHGYNVQGYPGLQDMYPDQIQAYAHKVVQRHTKPVRSQSSNQGLYSLLGLRHWFSSEGTSKR